MATHSNVLAWRIPGTGEPGGLPSMGSHRFGHDWSELAAAAETICRLGSLFLPIKPATWGPGLVTLPPLWFCFVFLFHCKGLYDYIVPTAIIQDNSQYPHLKSNWLSNLNSICYFNSPLPYNVLYSQIPGIKVWASWHSWDGKEGSRTVARRVGGGLLCLNIQKRNLEWNVS